MAARACDKLQRIQYSSADRNPNSLVLGRIPSENPIPIAPTDLRSFALPGSWNEARWVTIKPGNLEYLPRLPRSLIGLAVEDNHLRELPALPDTLRRLVVNKNQLLRIPPLPSSLARLEANHNTITNIDGAFPPTLTHLKLTHNALQDIPSLKETSIVSLGLGFNQLTKLPELPPVKVTEEGVIQGLQHLGCDHNQITEILDLPATLTVLNCSFNPLKKLQLENLQFIETILATNCQLTEIPVFYLPEDAGQAIFYFDNNPLTENFQAIYNRYETIITETRHWSPDATQRRIEATVTFQREVLEEHKRLLAERKESLSAIQQTLKVSGPLSGNYGPANLISQFITGIPGTTESQKLAVVEQQERVGALPKGTARQARKAIANVVVAEGPLAERAKLYVKKENIAAARKRKENREYKTFVGDLFGPNNNDSNNNSNNDNNNNDGANALRLAQARARQRALPVNALLEGLPNRNANWGNLVEGWGGEERNGEERNENNENENIRRMQRAFLAEEELEGLGGEEDDELNENVIPGLYARQMRRLLAEEGLERLQQEANQVKMPAEENQEEVPEENEEKVPEEEDELPGMREQRRAEARFNREMEARERMRIQLEQEEEAERLRQEAENAAIAALNNNNSNNNLNAAINEALNRPEYQDGGYKNKTLRRHKKSSHQTRRK